MIRETIYDLNDTIVAVSSPTSDHRVIVRITGPQTIDKCQQIFSRPVSKDKPCLMSGSVTIDDELSIDAKLYLFGAPRSYTGQDLAEIHTYTNPGVSQALMDSLLAAGLRAAGPGEFTARAYLNGKIDLAQAEAVNEIITSSNRFQLAAAEKLLAGRLAEKTEIIRESLMQCLGLIEAGLDFSSEDIEFITKAQAIANLVEIKNQLRQISAGSISYETLVDLPAVGIAGATNTGKSSLLNTLLKKPRSIVSHVHKTTRDVLTGRLTLPHSQCVLFDCAGLSTQPEEILDQLAQQAAIEALNNASLVLFCVDVSKADWTDDLSIYNLIKPEALIGIATKCDLISENVLSEYLGKLNELFNTDFLAASAKTSTGIKLLQDTIDKKIIELAVGDVKAGARNQIRETRHGIALTARHTQAVAEATENLDQAIEQLQADNDEVAAMMLRAAYQAVCEIEQQHIDEKILDNIFSRFCIGK